MNNEELTKENEMLREEIEKLNKELMETKDCDCNFDTIENVGIIKQNLKI